MDRLHCASAIFQMMVTNAVIGSTLKEAPRLHNVTGALEFKKEKELILSCVCFPLLTATMKYINCERLGCDIWLKLHNSEVI